MKDFNLDKQTIDRLVNAALAVRTNAYAPYSNFQVGAALLGADGMIFTGGNVENASYGLTICAERSAIVQAIAKGVRKFLAIAVASGTQTPVAPCGACLQVMMEFSIPQVIMCNTDGDVRIVRLSDLLPYGFNATSLLERESNGTTNV